MLSFPFSLSEHLCCLTIATGVPPQEVEKVAGCQHGAQHGQSTAVGTETARVSSVPLPEEGILFIQFRGNSFSEFICCVVNSVAWPNLLLA